MTVPARPLTFGLVDGLAFAAARGRLDVTQLPRPYALENLGPLLELFHLAAGGRLPDPTEGGWLDLNGAAVMIAALREKRERWFSSAGRRMGLIRVVRGDPDGDNRFTAFLMDAKRAARDVARLPGTTPGQLAAAMQELESNIHEHSGAADTGLLAFQAGPGEFEFVAADRGIGILASFQSSSMYASLVDHGKALELALTDGISRFGEDKGRGHGFRPIFLGLVNLWGSLRFRSGDHALTMDGTSPILTTAQLAQKATIDGFFVSIRVTRDSG
ncbi:MAG: hypothetical protein ACRD2G_02625 [Terriglobia bacterium]